MRFLFNKLKKGKIDINSILKSENGEWIFKSLNDGSLVSFSTRWFEKNKNWLILKKIETLILLKIYKALIGEFEKNKINDKTSKIYFKIILCWIFFTKNYIIPISIK